MPITVKEIGSEFESPNPALFASVHGIPLPSGAVLVGAGRHALSLVALDLRKQGIDTIVVPDHYCESMIRPFLIAGITVQFCATTDELILNEFSLAELLDEQSKRLAILHCETFGSPAGHGLQAVLDVASSDGIPVILDRTHSLLSPATPIADYEIASLRKLIPLPDGAYVRGLRSPSTIPESPDHLLFCDIRQAAAKQKYEYLRQGKSSKFHLDEFARAEKLLDQTVRPAAISKQAQALLKSLNFQSIRSARFKNAEALESALRASNVRVVNPAGWRNSPAYIVITSPDVKSLRAHLSSSQIYCPIHWPRPTSRPSPRSWREDLISLPIDHRYTVDDMHRIACAIMEFQGMRTK